MPDEDGPPNGASIANFRLAFSTSMSVPAAKSCADLAEGPRARLRRDTIKDHACKIAFVLAPCGVSCCHQIGLRTQDRAVFHDFQAVRGERCAACRNVDDHLSGAGRGRPFGRTRAFHDAVVDDAVRGKEVAREIDVLGRNPHLAVMVMTEGGGDVIHIRHRSHIDPGLWYGDNDIGKAEAKSFDEHDSLVGVGNHLTDEIFASDTEMDSSRRELGRDFRCRQVGDLDIVEAGDCAPIIARATRLDERQSRPHEESLCILL